MVTKAKTKKVVPKQPPLKITRERPKLERPRPAALSGPGLTGRPTDYKPEYDKQGFKLALLGYTEKEMAGFFECSVTTFERWKSQFPSFHKSIRDGKEPADMEVVSSLYDQARGFTYEIEETRSVLNPDGTSEMKTVKVKKFSAPDFRATSRWLGNRQRGRWSETASAASDPEDLARQARAAIVALDAVTDGDEA